MNWNSNWGNPQPVHPQQPSDVATVVAEPAKLDEPISEDMKQRLINADLPVTPDGVLILWQRTRDLMSHYKELELEIRKVAVKVYVPKPNEGMNNVELGNGFTLKAGVKFNYNLDKDNDKVEAALNEVAALGNEGPFIADRLVSWTPNFLLTEYRKLQEDAEGGSEFAKKVLAIISKVLTITDGAPTLEIKEPKAKKK